jgi:hypothetical protein
VSAPVKVYHLALTEQRFAALLRLVAECDEDTYLQLGLTKTEADMLSDLYMAMDLARQAQFTGTNINVTTH